MDRFLFLSVFVITVYFQGSPVQWGTGFFFGSSDQIFVVTNEHVVKTDAGRSFADSISIHLHRDRHNLTQNGDMVIRLMIDGRKQYHLHPLADSLNIDVVLIEVNEEELRASFDYMRLSSSYVISQSEPLMWGDEVLLMGYPLIYSDDTNNLPLLKRAIISTPFGVRHRGMPYFLIDGNLWRGMSGSPVFTLISGSRVDPISGSTVIGTKGTKLIGVFSGTPDTNLATSAVSSDVGVVWYADLLDEIILSIPK